MSESGVQLSCSVVIWQCVYETAGTPVLHLIPW